MQALYCFVFSVVGVNHLTVGGCEKADFKELNNHVNEANTKKNVWQNQNQNNIKKLLCTAGLNASV